MPKKTPTANLRNAGPSKSVIEDLDLATQHQQQDHNTVVPTNPHSVAKKPRKPPTAFTRWAKKKKIELEKTEGSPKASDAHLLQLWGLMELEDKMPFEEDFAIANAKYELDLVAFKQMQTKSQTKKVITFVSFLRCLEPQTFHLTCKYRGNGMNQVTKTSKGIH